MLRLEIVAPTYEDLVAKVAEVVGLTLHGTIKNTQPEPGPEIVATERVMFTSTMAYVPPAGDGQADAETAQAIAKADATIAGIKQTLSEQEPAKRKPGRPRKNSDELPPAPEAAPAAAQAPAVEPSAQDAPVAGQPGAEAITPEQFRERCQNFTKLGDVNAQLRKLTALINEFGATKVKEVDPKHFPAFLAKLDDLVKEAANG